MADDLYLPTIGPRQQPTDGLPVLGAHCSFLIDDARCPKLCDACPRECCSRAASLATHHDGDVVLVPQKRPQLHAESFADMPECNHRWIALPQFEAADVGSVHPHVLGQLDLRQSGCNPQPSHISPRPCAARRPTWGIH
jgi:hypothetical protein